MTIYGRRDLVSVTVSPEHGGCGQLHEYARGPGGSYASLTCDKGCEEWLRTDPLHATSPRDVPETYDDGLEREAMAKQGSRNRDYLSAAALAKIVGIPEQDATLGLALIPGLPAPAACAEGHENAPGAKFCVTCGASLTAPPAPEPVRCPDGHQNPAGGRFCGECGKSIAAAVAKPSAATGKSAKPRTRPAAAATTVA